jgi:hypothetical protein
MQQPIEYGTFSGLYLVADIFNSENPVKHRTHHISRHPGITTGQQSNDRILLVIPFPEIIQRKVLLKSI